MRANTVHRLDSAVIEVMGEWGCVEDEDGGGGRVLLNEVSWNLVERSRSVHGGRQRPMTRAEFKKDRLAKCGTVDPQKSVPLLVTHF